jgi:hypothetical protein
MQAAKAGRRVCLWMVVSVHFLALLGLDERVMSCLRYVNIASELCIDSIMRLHGVCGFTAT